MPMKCSHSARTDVGRHREHNEDDYGVGEGTHVAERGHLFVVCDGMGGHEAGEVASRIVVESILSAFYAETGEDRGEALSVALDYANTNIFNEGHQSSISMGTTGVAAVIHRDECIIANVGDSRAYLIRKGAIRQISRDHTLVNEQIAAGMITSADAEKMLYKHVITRTLGHQPDVIVDTFRFAVLPNDIIMLTSDGLINHLSDDDILAVSMQLSLVDSVDRLVDMANERGGNDNITVLMVRVDAVDGTSPLPIPVDAMPIVTGQYNPLRIQSSQSTASMRLMLAPQISWQGAGLAVVLLIILLTIIVLGLWGIWPFAPM
ncbi:MAG: Stp1/IreP family PP2C-type Ser/Thr phosphatase [Chloroflexaceae bacterium]|nr:Stp1/IreP family PP2C-type Ser/Thr phosphatase [Chloroflexaceae bacterium]